MEVAERLEVIRRLCSFEGRLAGTDAERRAANDLALRLRESGCRAETQPTYVHPQYGLVHAAHCALGVAGSLVSLEIPPLGFALVLAAALSLYLDLNARIYLLRRLFFRRASQNVLSRGRRPEALFRVILCAHYDAAQTGRAFEPDTVRLAARLQAALPFPIGPFRVIFWSLALLLPALGLRMAGIDEAWVSAIQLPATLVLIAAVFLFVDIALSPVAPGANDNASGVATVLSLAEQLDRLPPEHLDVWVLLTGAEECQQEGMRSFVRSHRKDLLHDSTYFVNLDTVGSGHVRYETAAGWVVTFAMDRRLVELCDAIAEADREAPESYGARPLRHGLANDSIVPRVYGYPATTIGCAGELGYAPGVHTSADTPDRIDPDALERAHSFALELVRQLDRDAGRRIAGAAPQQPRFAAERP